MAEQTRVAFPQRDAQGRIAEFRDLLGLLLAGVVAGAVVLVVFDGLFALSGLGEFGSVNGWLAVILPLMLLVEEFRAWRPARSRIVVALVAAAVGIPLGLLAAGFIDGLPSLLGGAVGAVIATIGYAWIWFYGIRAADRPRGEGEV